MEKMKRVRFSQMSDAEWREVAQKSLDGTSYDQLKTETLEGIHLDPLYTKQSVQSHFEGKEARFVKQVRQGMTGPGWIIAQRSYEKTSGSFLQEIKLSLRAGNEAIVYEGLQPVRWCEEDLEEFLLFIEEYPVYIFDVAADDPIAMLFNRVEKAKRKDICGMVTGMSLPEGYVQVRQTVISVIEEHLHGADTVTELAIVLAKAVEAAEAYDNFAAFTADVAVRFAIDTDFFMEIAKMRACRVLWQTMARGYGIEGTGIPIVAETSLRSFTKYDPATNILRAGNETLAAVLGGVDVFTVHPHMILEEGTNAANRIARNLQLVIREETMLKQMWDPAGGSYFIDTLTSQLAEQAWGLFLEIEAMGGLTPFIASGALAKRLEKLQQKRKEKLANGEKVLVGTSRYADPTEKRTEASRSDSWRLALEFEQIRDELSHGGPKTVLLRFGTLVQCKPMTDIAKGLLAIGGIVPEESPLFKGTEVARTWLAETDYDYHIICGQLDEWDHLDDLCFLKHLDWLEVAGSFTEAEKALWRSQGVGDFIEKGQHTVEKLLKIRKLWQRRQQS